MTVRALPRQEVRAAAPVVIDELVSPGGTAVVTTECCGGAVEVPTALATLIGCYLNRNHSCPVFGA